MIILISTVSNDTTESDLNILFAQFGGVNATRIIADSVPHSRSMGLVIMEDKAEGKQAILKLDHTLFAQQPIRVSEATIRK